MESNHRNAVRKGLARFVGAALLLASLSLGCASLPQGEPLPQSGIARTPEILLDPATGERSVEVSVLVYNVAGLPWPLGCGKGARVSGGGKKIPIACRRGRALKSIGDALGEMRRRGEEPDIVLIQEGFIAASPEIARRGGYPNWVMGPARRDRAPQITEGVERSFVDERQFWKGEKLGKLQSSGLFALSNFPILELEKRPFKEYECAGFDCLANKGILLVRVQVPGVPGLLEVLTTHLNARGASGVGESRSLRAHNLQIDEIDRFLTAQSVVTLPIIWGGDLNMRHARDRLEYLISRSDEPILEVSSYCMDNVGGCDVRLSWDGDEPWLNTQDLQGWSEGTRVKLRPIRVEALFAETVDGTMPSDHVGLLVRYRLSWLPEAQ